MVSPHLAHRLPWGSLVDVIRDTRRATKYYRFGSRTLTSSELKRIVHFARCLHSALVEFAATDKASDEEKELYDPKTWGVVAHSQGYWYSGYYNSVLLGYVELNLLLADAQVFAPMLLYYSSGQSIWTDDMAAMCGDHHNSDESDHPDWIAECLRPAFDGRAMKPLTPEVQQILRDHCGKLFRCMYSLLAPRGKIDVEFIARHIGSRFYFYCQIDDWLKEHPEAPTTAEQP